MQKLLLLILLAVSTGSIDASLDDEKVVLFVQTDNQIMLDKEVQALETLAESMEISFTKVTDKQGLPAEVTTLPSIYFQNRNGRSRYYGRYNNISRIKNFIRTCKLSHQKDLPNVKKNVLVWENERADISAPIKVTNLSGNVPKDYNPEEFGSELRGGIAKGMTHFKVKKVHTLGKNTRSFYFNIYPYVDEQNIISITAEIFSQYNCVKSVCKLMDVPVVMGKWKKRKKLYKEVGQVIEAEIIKQINSSTRGDAFVPVSADTETKTWQALDLELPKIALDERSQSDTLIKEMSRQWKVVSLQSDKDPVIIFSFLSPVDNYAGEVKSLAGSMALGEDLSMSGATGKFTVEISDVTMGAKDFDNEVQNKMLKMGLFPDAYFEFGDIESSAPFVLGQQQEMEIPGSFRMMGVTIPISVNAQIEPQVDDKGHVILGINCTFQLPLFEAFGVEGPDGPSPAKDKLQFYMRFNMEPII